MTDKTETDEKLNAAITGLTREIRTLLIGWSLFVGSWIGSSKLSKHLERTHGVKGQAAGFAIFVASTSLAGWYMDRASKKNRKEMESEQKAVDARWQEYEKSRAPSSLELSI